MIAAATDDAIRAAADHLAAGDLVGVPTETVYGLAADATDETAVRKIFAVKGRPPTNPLILHAVDAAAAAELVDFSNRPWLGESWDVASGFWPGPLTVVVPRARRVLSVVTAGRETVAVRVPNHPVMTRLLGRCEFPIAAPSANISNYISPTSARHVDEGLGDRIAMVLDGGPCDVGVESTIIELQESGAVVLRPGGVSLDDLRQAFGGRVRPSTAQTSTKSAADAPQIAPGQFPVHYAPAKPLRFREQIESPEFERYRVGRIAFRRISRQESSACHRVWVLSENGDVGDIARGLFGTLRRADRSDCDLLVIDRCEETGLGQAIMDRLRRAAGR